MNNLVYCTICSSVFDEFDPKGKPGLKKIALIPDVVNAIHWKGIGIFGFTLKNKVSNKWL